MATVFARAVSTINEHIKNIYADGELSESQTLHKFGNTEFMQKWTNYYSLDMIMAVWYRVRSKQWIMFRTRATQTLKQYLTQWFVLDEAKIKSGKPTEYFDKLQSRLREIRLSERLFYQKIKDIYTTSIDYDAKDDQTILFFQIVQNKLLRAISEHTAAELVYNRVDGKKPYVGMTSHDKKSESHIRSADVIVGKNYLNQEEITVLWLLVEQYLAFAESMAQAQIPMKMIDRVERLDAVLELNQKNILTHTGKISQKIAKEKAKIEYKKFKDNLKSLERQESIKILEQDVMSLEKNTKK